MHLEVTNKLSSVLAGKVVVADTSSLLIAGTNLLAYISDCTLVIPSIVVQELEGKRAHPTLGVLARQWINLLEKNRLAFGTELSKGVTLPDSHNVVLRVEPNHSNQETLPVHLRNGSNDSTVLAVAANFEKEFPSEVAVLSNDTPMRLKATLDLELPAYEFSIAELEPRLPFNGRLKLSVTEEEYVEFQFTHGDPKPLSEELWARMEGTPGHRSLLEVTISTTGERGDAYLVEGKTLTRLTEKKGASAILPRTEEQAAAFTFLKEPAKELPIVSIGGSAGTGKTLITVATAIQELKERKYQKIVVFRSLHEMGKGQEMGFLPGDVTEKMRAWAGAIFDSLDVIAATRKPPKKNEGPTAVEDRKKISEKLAEMIEVSPITYLRGRSLSNSFIILDEAQNFSRTELLNIISRVGTDSKLVLLWDAAQVDNKFLQPGAKADVWSVIKRLKDEELFAHVTLTQTERSKVAELASRILETE